MKRKNYQFVILAEAGIQAFNTRKGPGSRLSPGRRLLAFAGMTFLAVSCPHVSHAEATKEFTRDAGLYSGNPAGTIRMDLKAWGFSINTFNGEYAGLSDAPEGIKVVQMVLNSQWGGWGVANVNTVNPNIVIPRDFSDFYIGNGSLRFQLRSDKILWVEIEHTAQGTVGRVPVGSTGNQWQEIVIPLSSFTGVDFTKIRFPFIIRVPDPPNGNSSAWYVDHIRWTKPVASLAIFPSSTTVQQNKKRQFTVEGRDLGNERVIIYSTFSALSSVGSFAPVGSTVTASTFTANASNGVVRATLVGLSTQASVSVVAGTINEVLGLYSETIFTSIALDADSKLNVNFGGGGSSPQLLDAPSTSAPEGVRHFVTTITAQGSSAYAGWFIQWDLSASSAVTRDMSRYYQGSLRFWFKGPAALQNNLEISIRSGNVDPGTELSKVKLKDYATFDGTWRSVAIPIRALAGARPWADVSRTKILFAVFAVGAVGADQVFYLDNIRWDTNTPGALATMAITPSSVTVPLSSFRQFTVQGFDNFGVKVDIFPTWTHTPAIGTISPTQGNRTILTVAGSPASGTITATQAPAPSTSAVVNVANIIWTQAYNVYSDAGSGGHVGISVGTNGGTTLTFSQQPGGVAEDPTTYRSSTFTLVNNPGQQDAFALWYTNYDSGGGARFMSYFQDGYLSFWVRTPHDLQIAVRSANITAGAEKSKIRLSDYGIPTNNTWQKVILPLADFKAREPLLDFSQIQTYFAIGALSAHIGPQTAQSFDVDNVRWLTNNPGVPDESKMYIGLKEKQVATGLVRSFNNENRAVTYDEALAAMNYTYRKDTATNSKKVFDVYKYIHDNYPGGGTFNGFHDEYNMNTAVGGPINIIDGRRSAGPNAFLLLALIHYKNVTGLNTYDAMMASVAGWLKNTLQAGDGAIQFGVNGSGTLLTNKSTEHNFDCYAVFKAYARLSGDNTYNTSAAAILNWLQTEMYVPAQQRFNVGELSGGAANTDRGLDVYSWAPLALSSFTNVLATAETDFKNTKVCDLTGIAITGFDFSGPPGFPVDKDAVWLEGTGQMALAYYLTGDVMKGDLYVQELEKAIVNTSPAGQGMAYATNSGSAYGFTMNSLDPAASSAAWYLFAKTKFNPFKPFPLHALKLQDTASGVERSSVTWTASVPSGWVRANQMVRLDAQPISTDPWGVQVYTDNTNPSFTPRFVDPTPGNTINLDSDPSGLLRDLSGDTTTHVKLSMAWRIQDSSAPVPSPIRPFTAYLGGQEPDSFLWSYVKDRATPAIDVNGDGSVGGIYDGTVFVDGEDYITVRKGSGLHASQGPSGYFPGTNPDYVFLEAELTGAAAQTAYTTKIIVEFFLQ